MPKRIQRKRTKGWRMPKGAVYVGRPTIWGNPFVADTRCQICHLLLQGSAGAAEAFHRHVHDEKLFDLLYDEFEAFHCNDICCIDDWVKPLKGRDLACWCPLDQPCHADVLLELAN